MRHIKRKKRTTCARKRNAFQNFVIEITVFLRPEYYLIFRFTEEKWKGGKGE